MSARTNRLALETSPYLLQHAHNPVDWYPWGEEALARARAEDRPILLSIGYAACHWCHVMERESFEDEVIASLMNEHFVPIKVDREERPDLDEIYMAATVAISGSGGWPMTVFLSPDQRPFFAGTYFPPTDKYGRPGFSSVLRRIAELWKNDRAALLEQAAELTRHVRAQAELGQASEVGGEAIALAARQLEQSFDPRFGGFGRAPKFPPSRSLSLLLRHFRRSGEERALDMVRTTLDGMKNGGMYDHVGGGFARYSTDERWLVPHFEKMLYDNAELASVYLEGYQVTRDPEYRRVAAETLDYVVREMQSPDGGYYSATDADSEGVEGKFFVWTPDEIEEILGREEAEKFCLYYDITPGGNWEGHSIPRTRRSLAHIAAELGSAPDELAVSIARSKELVYQARRRRVPPLLDDKILVSWNGLMLSAMANGARVLGDTRYLESAERAATFLLDKLSRPDGGLYRTHRAGKSHISAYLEDYAFLADGLLSTYEAGGSARLLEQALRLVERMRSDFGDPDGAAFFQTASDHETLIARMREGHDGAIPNANAIAAQILVRLSRHLGREDLAQQGARAIEAYGASIRRMPRAFPSSLAVVDCLLEPPIELVLVGARDDARYRALASAVAGVYLPNRVEARVDPEQPHSAPFELPLVAGKTPVAGRAALYVCRNFTCQRPITDPAEVTSALADAG
jgi:uncharacterized protein YyaL (SSP411 family)